MTFYIDLNDYSGGPHWLSPLGKVNRKAIRAKHRAKYLAEKVRTIKPARPETMARLKRTLEEIRNATSNNRSRTETDRQRSNLGSYATQPATVPRQELASPSHRW